MLTHLHINNSDINNLQFFVLYLYLSTSLQIQKYSPTIAKVIADRLLISIVITFYIEDLNLLPKNCY